MSDLHFPFQDNAAITLALEAGRRFGMDAVLINGDLCDFHRCSKFEREVKAESVIEELRRAYEFLAIIRKLFPKATLYYKYGNHDERFDRYLRAKAPELMDLPMMRLSKQQWIEGKTLDDLGVQVIEDGLIIMLGKLPVVHGHEWQAGISAPVNAARGAFLRANASVLVAHSHQVSQHSEPDIHGKLTTTWSSGCLCQLHPQYKRINKWSQGFVTVEVGTAGEFHIDNKRIYQGKVW